MPAGTGGGGGSSGNSGAPSYYAEAETDDYAAIRYIAAWGLVLLLALLLNRSRWGHSLIYYLLGLALLLLLLTNYQAITQLLAPASGQAGGGPGDGGPPDPGGGGGGAGDGGPPDPGRSATTPVIARAPTFQVSVHP